MNKTKKIVLGVVIILVIAVGAFYGGMLYGKGQATSALASARAGFAGRTSFNAQPQHNVGGGGFHGGGFQGHGGGGGWSHGGGGHGGSHDHHH